MPPRLPRKLRIRGPVAAVLDVYTVAPGKGSYESLAALPGTAYGGSMSFTCKLDLTAAELRSAIKKLVQKEGLAAGAGKDAGATSTAASASTPATTASTATTSGGAAGGAAAAGAGAGGGAGAGAGAGSSGSSSDKAAATTTSRRELSTDAAALVTGPDAAWALLCHGKPVPVPGESRLRDVWVGHGAKETVILQAVPMSVVSSWKPQEQDALRLTIQSSMDSLTELLNGVGSDSSPLGLSDSDDELPSLEPWADVGRPSSPRETSPQDEDEMQQWLGAMRRAERMRDRRRGGRPIRQRRLS